MNNLYHEMLTRSLKNLGTFSTSYMEQEAREIFANYAPINGIDTNAYPELEKFSNVCENFILELSKSKNKNEFQTLATTCSSEAILLGMYFLKQYWQRSSLLSGSIPNIIISNHSHISWQKAAEFLNIKIKLLPISQKTLTMDTNLLTNIIDQNTIAICCTLGSPTTLCFDDITKVNKILEYYHQQHNQYIPIHVDAASGGFIAPFIYPKFKWGFNLSHVYSINISSHKYGLIYPSLGWILLRKIICPDTYAAKQDYLGKIIYTYGIRFSHTAAHLATQYHYIQTKGFIWYQNIFNKLFTLAKTLEYYLSQISEIIILSPKNKEQLPGLVFTLNTLNFNLHDLIDKLKQKGWILPIYQLPSKNKIIVTRIVLRYGMTEQTIESFITDLKKIIAILNHHNKKSFTIN